MTFVNIVVLILLILATAFFVATEFAIVRIRPSRVEQLALEGNKAALAAQQVTGNLDAYLSACQLGITITALGLGWIGEPTVERLLKPALEALHLPAAVNGVLTFLIAFALITYLHVVVGELAPKTIAIQRAEWIVLRFARPIIWFYKIMYPLIRLMNGSGNRLVKWMGLKPAKEHEEAHSEEELRIILAESYKSGMINKTEFGYVNRIFAFDELVAREIMVPRTDMVCLYKDHSLEENLEIVKRERYTRYPVVSGSKDQVIGVINVKELFLYVADRMAEHVSGHATKHVSDHVTGHVSGHATEHAADRVKGRVDDHASGRSEEERELGDARDAERRAGGEDGDQSWMANLVHPVLTVPETIPVNLLLRKMQQTRNHLAILVDEFGGTSGMVTIEDILEEIVGDIRDEFDAEEPAEVEQIGEEAYRVDGRVTIEKVNELFHSHLDDEELDTIGGWLYAQNPELSEGDSHQEAGLMFTVEQRDGHRIRKVLIRRQETEERKEEERKEERRK